MTNLETLQKQQLEAMNQMYAQTLNAATAMNSVQMPQIPVQAPQNNTTHLENQLAEMQANMQQMMQIISQQQQMIQAQAMAQPQVMQQQMMQQQMMQQSAPTTVQYATTQPEAVNVNRVTDPAPVTESNEDIYKLSSKIVKPCESCPFAQTCTMRTNQGINSQCGQEVLTNKQIMLQGGKMQARFNFDSNEIELLSNGKVVSVVQDIKSNHNKKFINFMVKNNQVVNVQVVSDQGQPDSIYTTCTVEVLGFVNEEPNHITPPTVATIPTTPIQEPMLVDEEETYLSDEEMAQYDAMYSSYI